MKATKGKYIIIYEWMNDLSLSGLEKLAYALVYGFCKSDEGCFHGKNAYLQEWLGCNSKQTIINIMNSLESKGLIIKELQVVDGKLTNTYMATAQNLDGTTVQKMDYNGPKNGLEQSKIWTQDNNKDNNIKISLTQDARTREIECLKNWLRENAPGTESIAIRNKVISKSETIEKIIEKLEPYIEQYYTEQLEFGKGNLSQRGRSDVLQHFAIRIQSYIAQEQREKEQEIKIKQPLKSKQDGTTKDLIAELRKRRRAKESSQL